MLYNNVHIEKGNEVMVQEYFYVGGS